MKYLIYLLPVLYVISPFDLLPDFLIGAGWIDDLLLIGILCWYHFVYKKRRASFRGGFRQYHQSTAGTQEEFQRRGSFTSGYKPENESVKWDPYEVLGIKPTAAVEEIKRAYRRQANQYHPDKVMHLGEEFKALAELRFKEIQKAYQELSAK